MAGKSNMSDVSLATTDDVIFVNPIKRRASNDSARTFETGSARTSRVFLRYFVFIRMLTCIYYFINLL